MPKHNIDKLLKADDQPYHIVLYNQISEGLERELKRQKDNGKKFITDAEIDDLVDKAIRDHTES